MGRGSLGRVLLLQVSSHLVPLLLQGSSHLVPLLLQESSLPNNILWVHTVAERFQQLSTADATYLVLGEGSRKLTQQATNLHVSPPFCELRYTDVHKHVTDT